MELKIIGKRLFAERIDKNVTEGEFNADAVGISLNRYHDGKDLSEYSFRITAYSESGEAMAEQVLEKDPPGEKTLRLVWNVSPMFTAESGFHTLTVAGVAPDNSAQIKFTSPPFRVNPDGRAEFVPEKTVAEQYLNQVQLETQKAVDAAKRAENAVLNGFELSAATEEKLGGVLSGGDIGVDGDGKVTVNSVGGKTVEADVPADAKFTDTVYTLPQASKTVLGGVMVDGSTIIARNGVISAVGGSSSSGDGSSVTVSDYVLPPATESTLGGVMVDGKTVTADENGVISVIGGISQGGVSGDISVENVAGLRTELDGKAEAVHIHGIDDVEGLETALEDKSPAVHSHIITDVSGLQDALSGKAGLSHIHALEDVAGLRSVLDGKADLSAIPAIPAALPADGGNAATVGGFTVGANVPADAKFTDTVYTLPKATSSVLGGVMVDGSTITADANGVISAIAAGSGITVDLIYEGNVYWVNGSKDHNVALPYTHTHWDYYLISMMYSRTADPYFGWSGCVLINTSHIIYKSRDSSYATTQWFQQYIPHAGGGNNVSNIQFRDTTHIYVVNAEQTVIWGIKLPSKTMLGTKA
ncbi:MAG: phage tail repeat domain-containing protein [Ruminococcus sp.]|nr:phage tail repeat domain-containing protein [Ruminococcus sp.]MCM1480599.1 phage tail repeat domain-containing protein [Muribaculaceae bacterium]